MPTPQTLKRYGLSLEEWQALYDKYDGACHICRKKPSTNRLCVDHEHVTGWKKMPPERRKLFVRGLLCWTCNAFILMRGVTIAKLEQAIVYMKEYERREK